MVAIWPGRPSPLGVTWDGAGANVALFSEVAEAVELCLFDADGAETRVLLPENDGERWHGYVPSVRPGDRYGFRVHGPWAPASGHRCNPAKLLLDPYARAVAGEPTWDPAIFGHRPDDPDRPDPVDSAPYAPRSVVVDPRVDWTGDRPPATPWSDTVIYECHVRGATMRHPEVPESLRGTYGGIAHPAFLGHLTSLGVTAVELLPIHQFVDHPKLVAKGLRNYWGYNSIAYFAPHARYAQSGDGGGQIDDFRAMVRALHAAGIEVILDVVYNHTGESDDQGPTLCFRGIDNAAYYRLINNDRRRYLDYTGTGNSINARHPYVMQLVMDSLRYWVQEMHVDGFRFDLASTLARDLHEVHLLAPFFQLIQQDPCLSEVKLIAEPWDIGEGGYQVGNFPALWAEWNGRYRDCLRDYWRGADRTLPEFAYRLTGSSDLYEASGRRPHASVNFVTAHDGFTLRDLVSYEQKRNLANGEDNQDGTDDNRSWNCGVEGPTDDPEVNARRRRQQRNFIVTLFVSQGIPMLLAGDELGHSQRANNNAYCQDNEISWLDWGGADRELEAFTAAVIAFRGRHRVLRRRRFFQGRSIHGSDVSDIAWFTPAGIEMADSQWDESFARSLGVFLNGDEFEIGPRGVPVTDDSMLLWFNAHHEAIPFSVPDERWGRAWSVVIDTSSGAVYDEPAGAGAGQGPKLLAGELFEVPGRSVIVLIRTE